MNSPEPSTRPEPVLGVLDLQGGVLEHLDHLERLGIRGLPVKTPEDISGLPGLILPGGESTCLSRLLRIFKVDEAIRREYRRGMKIWGTCAGTILLAARVRGEDPHLGLIDMEVERNSFGSQLDSFTATAVVPAVSPDPLPLTFIRSPKILQVGEGVDVLLRMNDFIAAVETPNALATVFHPELTGSTAFHRYFAAKCGLHPAPDIPALDPGWTRTSWTRHARVR
ncbi:MAG: pyridoxal 5'-phosphate synthase glutaminase subunit PdxT [Syntrophales bacterium]